MATYFVYRSAYETPLGRRIVRFPDDTLLDWFRRHWADERVLPRQTEESDRDRAHQRTQEIFGGAVCGFANVWLQMRERGAPPGTEPELAQWLAICGYPEGEILAQAHALQIATDDDDLELAVLMCDDHFVRAHPERTAFLLHEDLALPTDCRADAALVWDGPINELTPNGAGAGATYLALVVIHDTSWLSELYGAFRFNGLRLPDLVAHLQSVLPAEDEAEVRPWNAWLTRGCWPDELVILCYAALEAGAGADLGSVLMQADALNPHRSAMQMFRAGKGLNDFLRGDLEHCRSHWERVVERRDASPRTHAWQRLPTFQQATPHFAQLSFTERAKPDGISRVGDLNTHWYLFDDCWAGNYPDLARSLLWWSCRELPLFERARD